MRTHLIFRAAIARCAARRLAVGLWVLPAVAHAQPAAPPCRTDAIEAALTKLPTTVTLGRGALRIHNIYRDQALQFLHAHERPVAVTVDSLVTVAYAPHRAFWSAYLGDEAKFRQFSEQFLAFAPKVSCELIPIVLAADINGRFERAARWLEQQTGTAPKGTWYFAYGHAVTDMGGLGQLRMVADLSQLQPTAALLDNLVPHELAHMVYDRRPGAAQQPLTVLGRVVTEGLATYASWKEGRGARSPATVVGYTDAEWEWAVSHEPELRTRVSAMLCNRDPAVIDSVASRSISIAAGAPTAIGYFMGFRMLQQLAAQSTRANGWVKVFRMSPDALANSTKYFGRGGCR